MSNRIREVAAIFDNAETLEKAVFALQTHGFDRAAFSLLATEHAVEQKLGQRYKHIEEMEGEPKAPRETFFSRASRLEAEYGLAPALALMTAAVVGATATAITVPILVAAGSGAVVGGALGYLIHRHHAALLKEQLERGGLLLWVNVRTPEEESKAIQILQAHAARHVHAHDLAP
jgi:hypothetical protein